jgi:3-hydroxy-9,10-secoandrosta-1,3,5(10)-triene-9,17-dione monooxygenase reductase component
VVEGEAFRRLIARWATGVTVVTSRDGEHDVGLTVNSLLSVSLKPPMVLVSLTNDADSTPVIARSGRFTVNLLSEGQRALSERFAKAVTSGEKFDGVSTHRGPSGVLRLDGTLGAFDCEVERTIPVADHQLIVGRVVELVAGTDGLPLLFYRSRYGETASPDTVRFARPGP